MGKRSREIKLKIQPLTATKPSKFKVLLPFLLVFSLFLFVFSQIAYSSTYPSYLPKELSFKIDSLLTKIPFLPKTPRQVVATAFFNNKNLESYSGKMTVKVTLPDDSSLLNLDSTLKAKNLTTDRSSYTASFSGKLNLGSETNLKLETVEVGKQLYFKIEDLPNFLGLNFELIKDKWQKLSLEDFSQSLSVQPLSDAKIVSDINEVVKKIYFELTAKSTNQILGELKTETLSGIDYYVISPKIDNHQLTKLFNFGGEFSLTNTTVKLFIDKKDYFINEVRLVSDLKTPRLESENLKLNFTYSIKDLNEETISITTPQTFEEIGGILDMYLKLGNLDQTGVNSLKIGDLGENFLTVERLIKVLILLPKSI